MLHRNEVETIGNIGNVKIETINGGRIAYVSVAINNRKRNSETGEWSQYTDWVNWKFFGEQTISFIEKYLTKGTHVCVRGKVRQSHYIKRDGTKVYEMECIGRRIEFVQPKGDSNAYEPGAYEPEDGDMPY